MSAGIKVCLLPVDFVVDCVTMGRQIDDPGSAPDTIKRLRSIISDVESAAEELKD